MERHRIIVDLGLSVPPPRPVFMATHDSKHARPSPHGAEANAAARKRKKFGAQEFLGVFRYSSRAVELVWTTSKLLTVLLAALTLVAGLMPAAAAWVGQQIVDAVVAAAGAVEAGGEPVFTLALTWVALEAGIMVVLAGAQKGLGVCQSLLRAMLGHRVNVMILEKALTLQLIHFEDSDFYDKLTQARREASSRPLSLVNRTFGLVQNAISLTSYAILLLSFSPWAVLVLVLGGLPAFIAEAKFSGEAFRLFRWRSPETRKQMYLETVLAREDYAKEVKLYGLGPLLLERYREIFHLVFAEDRNLTLRRGLWGFGLGLLGTAAFYGAYAWIAIATVRGAISLGEMTMYLLVFRQGQSAVSASLSAIGGMYEDNLYLSNLYEYLDQPIGREPGTAVTGPKPGDGVRFEGVSFTYPGATTPAIDRVDLHLKPGQSLALVGENGSGKTTLIKLLTRLYEPSEGRIVLDGLELGGEVNNTFLLWNTSTTAQLRQAANELPTHVLRVTPTVRYAPLRRQGLALYFLLGLGPSIFTRGGQVSAHWLGATGLLIRLGGRVHLNLAFRFTQPFPVSRCEEAFIEHEAPIPGGALLGYCEFRFGPHLGIVVAL